MHPTSEYIVTQVRLRCNVTDEQARDAVGRACAVLLNQKSTSKKSSTGSWADDIINEAVDILSQEL